MRGIKQTPTHITAQSGKNKIQNSNRDGGFFLTVAWPSIKDHLQDPINGTKRKPVPGSHTERPLWNSGTRVQKRTHIIRNLISSLLPLRPRRRVVGETQL